MLHGAAFFVRRSAFEAVGGFDPGDLSFHEDDDLARRLKAECGPLMFIREPLVQHGGGSSSARTAEIAALKAWHMGHSRVYAARASTGNAWRVPALTQATLQLISPLVVFTASGRNRWRY
ncbi:MAG: hypothetical protein M9957_02425 [Rhodobacteraceae bacterium]|nr:hypothetical protein [Paracoccaceae bacterium]